MEIKIGNKIINSDSPTFLVAEMSANHNQDLATAVKSMKIIKKSGADAIKFQTYMPSTMTIDADNKYFRIKHPKWGGQTLYQLYKKAYTPWKWFKKLKNIAEDLGLVFFATAFDKTSVDFLQDLGVVMHKIASFELVDIPLIEYVAKTRKPLILSTGMATFFEIKDAVNVAKAAGAREIILLKCVSSYPADPKEMNLQTIPHMGKTFGVPVGLSDHTLGIGVSIAAVSLGAKVIEKHFTLNRSISTPDSFFSIEPRELRDLVVNIRMVEQALGNVCYYPTRAEKENKIFRRSLFVVKDIKKGEFLTEQNIRSIRPGYGLAPKYLKDVLGKKVKQNIKKGTPLSNNLFK